MSVVTQIQVRLSDGRAILFLKTADSGKIEIKSGSTKIQDLDQDLKDDMLLSAEELLLAIERDIP